MVKNSDWMHLVERGGGASDKSWRWNNLRFPPGMAGGHGRRKRWWWWCSHKDDDDDDDDDDEDDDDAHIKMMTQDGSGPQKNNLIKSLISEVDPHVPQIPGMQWVNQIMMIIRMMMIIRWWWSSGWWWSSDNDDHQDDDDGNNEDVGYWKMRVVGSVLHS